MIKKWIALTMAALLCISLAACGAAKEMVTVDQLETAMKANSSVGSGFSDFALTENGDGYSFKSTVTGRAVFADAVITGTADKDRNIQSVEFVYSNVTKTDDLTDVEALKTIAAKSVGDLTRNDMATMQIYLDWEIVCKLFCGNASENYDFSAPIEGNGWKITTSVSGSQVTIKAE